MKYLYLILISLGTFQYSFGQNNEKLDRYFQKKMENAELVGLQVAYVSINGNIWQGNYGLKEIQTEDRVDENTLFMIASCSKPITALGVLKLVEAGLIQLDDEVNDHLPFTVINPNFPNQQITVRMLLSHMSSLKDNWDILSPLYTTKEGGDSPLPLKEFLSDYFIEGNRLYDEDENFWKKEPGTLFRYSNVGYALLGLMIEHVSSKPFNEFIRTEVFEPLEMDHSYWFLANIPHDNIAKPHEKPNEENSLTKLTVLKHYGYPDYPDGQIRTTAADYGRFLQMLLNKGQVNGEQFIKAELIDEFLKIQYPEVTEHQAIAWNYNEFDHWLYYILMPRLPSHTGADPGVTTAVSFDPKNHTAAIIFTNSPPSGFLNQKIFYQVMMKKLLKEAEKN